MTSRERLVTAANGGSVDRQPLIGWPHPVPESDALFFETDAAKELIETAGDKLALVEVLNPFGLAIQREIDLNQLLIDAPAMGDRVLTGLREDVQGHVRQALENGADGVLYRLYGARSLHCTPMQYGGHYLEGDREILAEAAKATFNMIFVVGDDDVYLDFVSDLPAQAFGWDHDASKISAEQVKSMRKGALVSTDPSSDIRLEPSTDDLSTVLEASLHTEDTDA